MADSATEIQIGSTLVTCGSITHKGVEYAISRITSLDYLDSRTSYNGVPTGHQRFLIIGFADDSKISVNAVIPILQKKKFENIEKAFSFLSKATFQQRLSYYNDAWKSVGYFDYGSVRISADGSIFSLKKPNYRLCLSDAYSQGRLGLGMSWGAAPFTSSGTDPFVIYLSEKPLKGSFWNLTFSGIRFQCRKNRDVVLALLRSFDSAR